MVYLVSMNSSVIVHDSRCCSSGDGRGTRSTGRVTVHVHGVVQSIAGREDLVALLLYLQIVSTVTLELL